MTFVLFVWYMIFAHYIGDYVLKSEYLSLTKGKEWYNMLVHCILYTGSVGWVLIGWTRYDGFPYMGMAVLFVSHWIIDSWKCRELEKEEFLDAYSIPMMLKKDSDLAKDIRKHTEDVYLYVDQACHFIVLGCLMVWYGWFG